MADVISRRVLITGVSSGLGEALATHYLNEGWRVYGLSRREPQQLMEHENFSFSHIDLAEFQSVALGIRQLIDVKELDLVILNAGIVGIFGNMGDASLETLHKIMDVNVWSNKIIIDFFNSEAIAVKQIVAISSGASRSGAKGWNGYGISKAALNMMVKLYAIEMSETHFCALAPGLVDSPMQEYLCNIDGDNSYPILEKLKSARNSVSMPQPADAAEQIAAVIPKLPNLVKSGDYADIRKMPRE